MHTPIAHVVPPSDPQPGGSAWVANQITRAAEGGGSGSTSGSVTLAGVSGTGGVGTLFASVSAVVAGVSGTGAVGNLIGVAGDRIVPIAGVSATGAVGNLALSVTTSVPITGVAGIGAVGVLTVGLITSGVWTIQPTSGTGWVRQ